MPAAATACCSLLPACMKNCGEQPTAEMEQEQVEAEAEANAEVQD